MAAMIDVSCSAHDDARESPVVGHDDVRTAAQDRHGHRRLSCRNASTAQQRRSRW